MVWLIFGGMIGYLEVYTMSETVIHEGSALQVHAFDPAGVCVAMSSACRMLILRSFWLLWPLAR